MTVLEQLCEPLLEVWQTLFGCQHWRYSRVWTPPGTCNHYVVCERCKRQISYDLAEMKLGQPIRVRRADTLEEV